MIENLVFHIGDPKNGSSSIQTAMQMGACHPEGLRIVSQPELNASAMANALNPNRLKPGRRERQRREEFGRKAEWVWNQDADLGIISAEFFSAASPKALREALAEFMPDHAETARMVAYVRPHGSRALSGYAQGVKSGARVDNMDMAMEELISRKILYYTPRFRRWRRVFGDRFILRPFLRSEMQGGDVVRDFFHTALEGAPFALDPLPSSNETLSLEEVAAMRRIQGQMIAAEVPEFIRLSLGGAIGRALAARPRRFRTKLVLDRANAERLRAIFVEDAQALDRAFFGRPLMATELDAAVEAAAPAAKSLEPEDYYSAVGLQRMERISGEIAELVKARPRAWRHEYQRRIGQRLDRIEDQKEAKALRKNADRVWALLEELVSEMTAETAPAG